MSQGRVKEEYVVASIRKQIAHLESMLEEFRTQALKPHDALKRISDIETDIRQLRAHLHVR